MAKRIDHLGLRSAMADRLLPIVVAAMSFIAVLAIAGTLAAASLANQWQRNTSAALTVQVLSPNDAAAVAGKTRVQAVSDILQADPDVSAVHPLSAAELNDLLQPWLGDDASKLAMPLPAVMTATWNKAGPPESLAAALDKAAPGTLAETGARWAARVAALTASLQASAVSVLLIVAFVAAAVVAVATHAGLAQRRDAIEIIHGLGALDGDIAGRFAGRTTVLAMMGAIIGALCALPVLYWLTDLAAPFGGVQGAATLPQLPVILWFALPAVPITAAAIGWLTTQLTVRGWLRRLA